MATICRYNYWRNRYDEGKSNVGKIYVYLGASNGLSMYPDWSYTGNIMDGNLGISVAAAGDINGDGFGEIIIGSFGYRSSKSNWQRLCIFRIRQEA